jgi:hypothetical protein
MLLRVWEIQYDRQYKGDRFGRTEPTDRDNEREERATGERRRPTREALQPIRIALKANKQLRRLAWEKRRAWMFSLKECMNPESVSNDTEADNTIRCTSIDRGSPEEIEQAPSGELQGCRSWEELHRQW